MLERILRLSIGRPAAVLTLVLGAALVGAALFPRLSIDAVPDITNVQVQINTDAPGYSPLEAEQRITFPVETAMSGLPRLDYTRSLSRYGLSQVTVVFEDGTDIYFARQLVAERLQSVLQRLPEGLEPAMGPIATGLGEIYMYTVEPAPDAKATTLDELRTVQDWIVRPQLRTVRGVVDVNSIGGYERQVHITPDVDAMRARGVTLSDLTATISRNTTSVGAGYIEKNGAQVLVRVPGQLHALAELESLSVRVHDGVPVRLRDVARVAIGGDLRSGAATEDGREVVLGTVFMLMGENSRTVARAVDEKMHEVKASLPEGVVTRTLYDRTTLVNAAIATVRKSLVEGAALVIAVLFLFLGNVRAALITAMVIPLSMLLTITGMVQTKISGNLMSLGALDFGLIVDGAVIIVENCIRRLSEEQRRLGRLLTRVERLRVVFEGTHEVRRATLFGELIIMAVYVPILALSGVEGKMFHPMAYTVLLALFAAMVLSVTFVPAATALVLSGKLRDHDGRLVEWTRRVYGPALRLAIAWRTSVVALAVVVVVAAGLLATRMGSEFVPSLDEGDVALHALRIPGTSLTQAIEMQHALERRLERVPEVGHVFAKLGTAEIATDPMPPSVADGFVMLEPRERWPDPRKSKAAVVAELERAAAEVAGNNYEFTQPIQMRMNELIAGVRSDVALKVFGDDLEALVATGHELERVLESIPGARDVKAEPLTGLPMLSIQPRRDELARYGIALEELQSTLRTALAGTAVGSLYEGDRRFEIVVRFPENIRGELEALRRLPIALPSAASESDIHGPEARARFIPLSAVADLELGEGPNQVTRENGKRRVVVTANVRGRDLGSFVTEAKREVAARVKLPPGTWLGWGGQFEQLESASTRLTIVVPIVLLLIFFLLYSTFGNAKDALLVFTGVPLALTGGVASLWLRDIPLSISAGVGFIALSGVAVLNGLVLVTVVNSLVAAGRNVEEALEEGTLARLRPVLMTALVASLGFVPMALATGTGAEVQRPLATVVIGGIVSSTILTLLVLPGLYRLVHGERRAFGSSTPR